MFVIGQVGSFIMNLNFEKYAEEKLGLKDPFKANMENFKKTHKMYTKEDGSMVIEIPDKQEPDPYDKTYINNYIKERNIFTFEKVMEKFGYSQAILYCQKEGVDIKKYLPCKGADGQCNFECSYFNGGICTHD